MEFCVPLCSSTFKLSYGTTQRTDLETTIPFNEAKQEENISQKIASKMLIRLRYYSPQRLGAIESGLCLPLYRDIPFLTRVHTQPTLISPLFIIQLRAAMHS